MATNLTVEAPNFDKIAAEAGQFTADAVNLLWAALNDTRATARRDTRTTKDMLQPKILTLAPTASVDNLDLAGTSVLQFNGTTAVNVTGFRAPDTHESRVVVLTNTGTATLTCKNQATSETENRLQLATNADTTRAQYQGIVFVYAGLRWYEVARSG